MVMAGPSGRAVTYVGLWSLTCGNCWLESRRGHGCVSCVCFQVEVTASELSLVQRIATERGVSEWNHEVLAY
jgi:hypothetical protein